ncbi:MAG: glycerol kinase GlpK [Polyangia bacterium]|nr:glycerol kinase GlpK [Polyangia bacterium]
MAKNLVAIDQGTTQTTVLVLSDELQILARASREFPQIYPRHGWVEHDPEAIWASVTAALREALSAAGISASDIAGVGITNQRETTVLWDRKTDAPVHNAIVWQCRRTADLCETLRKEGHEQRVRQLTGLVLDPYFSGTKVRWILDNVPGARPRAEAGELAFGTIDSFLVWKLTRGASHVTDLSNASRTMLCNLRTGDWDDSMLSLLQVPKAVLPRISACAEVVGETRGVPGLPDGIPVAGMAGDQQAALFGQACFEVGQAKCTYGTGAFLMMNVGAEPIASAKGLLTTVAWKLGPNITYAMEGSLFIAGAAVQWLRDGLGIISSAPQIEALAEEVPDSGGVIFVPALAGLGAPHWRADARGLISGLTRSTTRAHLARACLEGIALQVSDLIEAMETDAGRGLGVLRVDGGAAANDLLMQFQADVLRRTLSRPANLETTAFGAAFLAGLGAGVWSSTEAITAAWRESRRFEPVLAETEADAIKARWRQAVSRA